MTDDGMKLMAEAIHEAGFKTTGGEDKAVKDALAALRAQDNDQTAKMFEVLEEIKNELGKTEFKNRVAEFKKKM